MNLEQVKQSNRPVHRCPRTFSIMLSFLIALVSGCATVQHDQPGFSVGVLGDTPYGDSELMDLRGVLDALDALELAFIVHAGDIRSAGEGGCSAELYAHRRAQFESTRHPFILTPGDNDWADCNKKTGLDRQSSLEQLRETFFDPSTVVGAALQPESQAQLDSEHNVVENLRWSHAGVYFATLHVLDYPDTHLQLRDAATAWLESTFTHAREASARAVVLLMQADPDFEADYGSVRTAVARKRPYLAKILDNPQRYPDSVARLALYGIGNPRISSFEWLLEPLRREVAQTSVPVVLIHGDSHYFRFDQPLLEQGADQLIRLQNFFRLETHGSPFSDQWVVLSFGPGKQPQISVSSFGL